MFHFQFYDHLIKLFLLFSAVAMEHLFITLHIYIIHIYRL